MSVILVYYSIKLSMWPPFLCTGCRYPVGAQRQAGQHNQKGLHTPSPGGQIRKHKSGKTAACKGRRLSSSLYFFLSVSLFFSFVISSLSINHFISRPSPSDFLSFAILCMFLTFTGSRGWCRGEERRNAAACSGALRQHAAGSAPARARRVSARRC